MPENMEVFTFGSNEKGVHGAGAAFAAYRDHGAIYGQGEGLQGQSYAIPTKDGALVSRTLDKIRASVETFKSFAAAHPEMTFRVTRIGCGLAGFRDTDIAPMFKGSPVNVKFFDETWEAYR